MKIDNLELKSLYSGFRDPKVISSYAKQIAQKAKKLNSDINIMEVCGGHTHTIMKYALKSILPDNIRFVHGPGCPVCIMPQERIQEAIILANQPNVILATLGDMIRVPSGSSSLAHARANGADVRSLYSPLDIIEIAKQNPTKDIVYFAIGFETTTPMTTAVIDIALRQNINNIYYHINHVLVPPAIEAILSDSDTKIDALIAPSHVSVITGSKIYNPLSSKYNKPIVIGGFEPIDVLQSVDMIVDMILEGSSDTQIQYTRSVTYEGNTKAQSIIDKYLECRDSFVFRGIGDIAYSALRLRDEYSHIDAEYKYKDILHVKPIDEYKSCICGDILRGKSIPKDCKLFATTCTPTTPIGSCMVSDEGACNAYYRYAKEEI